MKSLTLASVLNWLMLTVISAFIFSACKKDISREVFINGNNPDPNISVYVVGVDYNGSYLVKKYWKNGTPVALNMGDNAFVTGITISGGDVYVAAFENNGTHYVAKYFKNGNPVALTNGNYDAYTSGIVVVANDVYVSGSENDGIQYSFYDDAGDLNYSNYSRAKYWKNGNPVVLTDSSHNAYTADIGVVNNDVYVVGSEMNGSNSMAKYWKNGNPIPLPGGSNGSTIALAISGTDVYVLGYGGGSIKYWKNETPTVLFNNSSQSIQVRDIAVSGNDVYILGTEYNGTNDIAKYWKNGNPILLNGNIPHAFDIVVDGSDAYVAGYDFIGYSRAAKYWKNGDPFVLTNSNQYSYAIGIAVTR